MADLLTPSLVVDLDVFDANVAAMQQFASSRQMRLRVHGKMHKCSQLARRQIDQGAVGICVQKLGEAVMFWLGGVSDILITNEIVCPRKLDLLMALSGHMSAAHQSVADPRASSLRKQQIASDERLAAFIRQSTFCDVVPANEGNDDAREPHLGLCIDSLEGWNQLFAAWKRKFAAEKEQENPLPPPPASSTPVVVASVTDPRRSRFFFDVYIELNVGQSRCGVEGGSDAALALLHRLRDDVHEAENQIRSHAAAQHVPPLRLRGVHAYHGSAQHRRTLAERVEAIEAAKRTVETFVEKCEKRDGHSAPQRKAQDDDDAFVVPLIVTGAGTGTFFIESTPVTLNAEGTVCRRGTPYRELQPGSYAVMDVDYGRNRPFVPQDWDAIYGAAEDDVIPSSRPPAPPAFGRALFVKAMVTGVYDDRFVLDAGQKNYSVDSGLPVVAAISRSSKTGNEPAADFAFHEAVRDGLFSVTGSSDDHTVVKFSDHACRDSNNLPLTGLIRPGDIAWLVPGHCDPTFNLYAQAYGVRGLASSQFSETAPAECPLVVDARGMQQ